MKPQMKFVSNPDDVSTAHRMFYCLSLILVLFIFNPQAISQECLQNIPYNAQGLIEGIRVKL